jgi:hypothetical protein
MTLPPPPAPPTLTLDMIDSVGFGYRAVWRERVWLAKLMIIPILIKFASLVAILSFGYEDDFLMQGLILLPSYFAEGWVLAQFLRLLLMEERWPILVDAMPEGPELERLILRARGILSSILIFVLWNLLLALATFGIFQLYGHFGISLDQMLGRSDAAPSEESVAQLMPIMIGIAVIAMAAFRLWFLYVPFAVLVRPKTYLNATRGFTSSLRMLAIFIMSWAPINLMASMLVGLFAGVLLQFDGGQAAQFVVMLIQVVAMVLVSVVVTAAIAYALRDMLPRTRNALSEPDDKS